MLKSGKGISDGSRACSKLLKIRDCRNETSNTYKKEKERVVKTAPFVWMRLSIHTIMGWIKYYILREVSKCKRVMQTYTHVTG